MNVGPVSCPDLGFPEAVHVKLPHKTCECLSLEAFQGQNLTYYQILFDDDAVPMAVPDDGTDFTVVDQLPQFHREDVRFHRMFHCLKLRICKEKHVSHLVLNKKPKK